MGFTTELIVKEVGEYDFELHQPLVYDLYDWKIVVPKGFVTDFATSPWMFWWLIPKVGSYKKSAVIHDYLLSLKKYSRRYCDATMYQAMIDEGVPWWKRTLIHGALSVYTLKVEEH